MSANVFKCAVLSVVVCVLAISSAEAYLGGFEPADGYLLGSGPILQSGANPPSPYTDVTYYNAGQFGANAGGGSSLSITPDSGLWDLVSTAGAFFRTPADRLLNTGTAPPYGAFPSFTIYDVPAYAVGNHSPGYLSPSALALRNETAWNNVPVGGPIEYDYTLDTYDFGGPLPASITTGVVSTSFRFCPNPAQAAIPGTAARDKFIMSFRDSVGNTGVQIGYADDNEVYWRPGNAGSWNYTGIYANSTNWDQFTVDIDLTGFGTFDISYLAIATNTTTQLALNQPLGASMQDLTHLRWWLNDQVVGGTGGKNFFDAFSFRAHPVPEPSSIAILATSLVAGAVACRYRR